MVVGDDNLLAQGFLLGPRLGDGVGGQPLDRLGRGVRRVIARSGLYRRRLPRVVAEGQVSVGRVALAVCLLFDRRSERAVRALWDRLERAGVPSLRSHTHGRHLPHVSYAVLRTWDLAAVSAAVAGLGPVAPVELMFDGVGLFRRGRVWLLAGGGPEFVTRQERVVEAVVGTGAELHKHYRPGRWLPHCSVAPRAPLAQLPVLAATIYDVLPLEARLDRLALVDSATGEVWPVAPV